MTKDKFYIDFLKARELYTELEYKIFENSKYKYRIDGIINVLDSEGTQRGIFRVSMHFKFNYPMGFGLLQETSNFISRNIDRHIDNKGFCCICGPIEYLKNTKKSFTILDFILKYVIPFLANQIYFDEYGYYKNGEYSHFGKGLLESLEEEFRTKDQEKINKIIDYIRSKPSINAKCYCGGGKKIKKCHYSSFKILQKILGPKNIFLEFS